MKIQFLFFLPLILWFSCAQPASEKESAASEETSSTQEQAIDTGAEAAPALELGTFGELSEITGCSCYLAESEDLFKKGAFLYAEQYEESGQGGFAILSINGTQERLDIQTVSRDSRAGKRKVAASNTGYKYYLILQEDASDESETPRMRGVLHLESMEGEVVEKEVVGTCGC